jgi:tRNA A58 N-methylase Trm61
LGCRLESHQDAYHLGHQEVKEEIGQGEKSSSKEGDLEESPEKEKNFEFLIIDIQKEKEN